MEVKAIYVKGGKCIVQQNYGVPEHEAALKLAGKKEPKEGELISVMFEGLGLPVIELVNPIETKPEKV